MLAADLAAIANHLAEHRYGDARAICDRLLAASPEDPEALHMSGLVRFRQGEVEDAIEALGRSLELRPDSADVLANLAQMQFELGHFESAHDCFAAALDLAPGDHMLQYRIGQTLFRLKNYAAAEAVYREVLQQEPDFVPAHYDLALVLSLQDKFDAAIASYDEAARRDPAELDARSRAANLRQSLCRWDGLGRVRPDIIEPALRPGSETQRPPVPLEVLRLPIALSAAEFRKIAVDYARAHGLVAQPAFQFRRPDAGDAGRRLRIGYLSSDFGDHPVGHIVASLFGHHDRARFETIAYALARDDRGPERRQLSKTVDRMVDLAEHTVREAAQRIHEDGVDILIDLAGHTKGNGLEILARRPAPLQVTWLGFPGTLGVDFIDYMLVDPAIAPAAEQPCFTEALVHLPGPYFATAAAPDGPAPSRQALGLPTTGLVFEAFTLSHKIEPRAFAIWMRLLAKTPGSALWLRVDHPAAHDTLRREAATHGIAAERLVFAPRLPRGEHLARQRAADLYLDTLFYNGHSTVADVLGLGVPAVTLHGDRFAARVGASLVRSVGLNDLIARTPEEYEAIALRLASDPAALAAVRNRLAKAKATSPLFDTARFVRHLEAAYRTMWEAYVADRPPQPFSVTTA
ncbi:MAG TPA: tetratricopeptide repeat protein [Alphaproteobacteria bacterium]